MNKLITRKIAPILFFVIICHYTAKAQDSAKKVIVVVRPGGIAKTSPASAVQASQSNAGYAPGAPGSGTLQKPVTASTSTIPVTPKTAVAASPAPKKAPYVAPGSRVHSYNAPSTSERAGTATYAPHAIVPASKQGAPTGAGTAAANNSGKYAAAAPSAPVSAVTVAAAVPVTSVSATVPPGIALAKKDTVAVTKVKNDTVPPAPVKHKGNKILFAEIGGPGIAISINYDQRFDKTKKDGFGFRAGVGYFAAGNNTVFTIPVQVNYLYGKDGKYIELGLGTTFVNSKGDNYSSPVWEFDTVTGLAATAVIGVRYEPNNALNFRLGYVPIVSVYGLTNAGGFSIGYTF